jgi:hypothetical protein
MGWSAFKIAPHSAWPISSTHSPMSEFLTLVLHLAEKPATYLNDSPA